jgi:sterol desaturase/sphingolipid hydroxylase (fatty acid hydroxylase superfamily)
MGLFNLEHGKLAYRADFALYAAAVVCQAIFLTAEAPAAQGLNIVAWGVAGLLGWSLVEYLLHRFVLHGVQPFQAWHATHHDRPMALICTPTLLSAGLIVGLVFAPALLLAGLWPACSLTVGVVTGYLAYAVVHHATHHGRTDNAWLRQRKRWHAAHHHSQPPVAFGVSSAFWDRVFGSTPLVPAWRHRNRGAEARSPPVPQGDA